MPGESGAVRRAAVATGRILDELATPGWVTRHDVGWPGPYPTVDHLVVGPSGIFVIHTENWSGRISVEDQILLHNGQPEQRPLAECSEAALGLAAGLPEHLRRHVYPVLCFVREEPLIGWARDVVICSSATVADTLRTRATEFSPVQFAEAVALTSAWLDAATGREAPSVAMPQRGRSADPEAFKLSFGRTAACMTIAAAAAVVGMLMLRSVDEPAPAPAQVTPSVVDDNPGAQGSAQHSRAAKQDDSAR